MNAAAPATTDTILNPATTMDAVTLHVGDLEKMSSYYAQALALTPIEERTAGREVVRILGRRGVPLIRLIATPGLPGVDRRRAGTSTPRSSSRTRRHSRRPSPGPPSIRRAGSWDPATTS